MAGSTAKRPTDTRKKEHRLSKKMRAFTQAMLSPRKGWKAGDMSPKAHTSFMPQEIKHQPEHTVESNKHEGNRNGVKARKKWTQTEWSMHKGPRHHLLVPSQYMGGGSQVKVFKGCGLAVRRKRGSILGFSLKLLWGEMSCWGDISPKRSKYGLGPLDACHRGR